MEFLYPVVENRKNKYLVLARTEKNISKYKYIYIHTPKIYIYIK